MDVTLPVTYRLPFTFKSPCAPLPAFEIPVILTGTCVLNNCLVL